MKWTLAGAWNPWNGAIALLALAIIIALVLGPRGELSSAITPTDAGEAATDQKERDQRALRSALDAALAAKRGPRAAAPAPDADPVIADHLVQLDKELEPDEAAARLSALGNLLRQKKGDYRAAAGYYEILIERYPDWEGILGAYRELISCYEALERHQDLRQLYRHMLEVFPEGSDGHRVAMEALDR